MTPLPDREEGVEHDRGAARTATAVLLVVVAVLAALVAYLVVSRTAPTTTPSTGTGTGPSTSVGPPATTPPGLKPQITGFIDQLGLPPASLYSSVSAFVVSVPWATLQPVEGGPIAPDNPVDQAIAQVRQIHAQDPSVDLGIVLRVEAGIYSPEWAKAIDGGPTTPVRNGNGVGAVARGGTLPKFWTEDFGQAWSTFMDELAAKYDDVPEIREADVTTRCMTIFAEPLVRQTGPSDIRALLSAGYTESADDTCQHQAIDEAKVWHHTFVAANFNPYDEINADGTVTKSVGYAIDLMHYCRNVLGGQCVLQNNEVGRRDTYPQLYDAMAQLGAPIAYQLANAAQLQQGVGFAGAVQFALGHGANAVEIEPSHYVGVAVSQLSGLAAELRAQPRPASG